MPLRYKLGLVMLAVIFVVLGIFLVIGRLQGDTGTDTNNSDVTGNTMPLPGSPVSSHVA